MGDAVAARKKSGGKAPGSAGRAASGRRKASQAKKSAKKKSAGRKKAARRAKPVAARPAPSITDPVGLARSAVSSLADRLTEVVEHAAANTLRAALDAGGREIAGWLPESAELRREAGSYLRDLREVAGLTVDELADAVELSDASLLASVEAGTSTLSFELIMRLAAVLARHDPVPFVSRLVRTYNPVLWQLLEDWGIGRLPLQLERERKFVNILRGHDATRSLSDDDFDEVLDFTRAAFELALEFATKSR
jgi:transcriptional regulator with XRE-family HTH domain